MADKIQRPLVVEANVRRVARIVPTYELFRCRPALGHESEQATWLQQGAYPADVNFRVVEVLEALGRKNEIIGRP